MKCKYILCIFLNIFILSVITAPNLCAQNLQQTEDLNAKDFQTKLNVMLNKIDNSIKILREQIAKNQSAPFLADLYLQLANLLIQKANTLYYIQMEKSKDTTLKKLDPVIDAQKEGIKVYEDILRLFPSFDKKSKVIYLLAAAYKSIDDNANFMKTAKKLITEFPNTQYAVKAQLLIADYMYSKQDYKGALEQLVPLIQSKYVFEKNQARYRAGLCYLRLEKFQDALKMFEAVITDETLQDDEVNVGEEIGDTKAINLKREALIDSILAYTNIYKNNPKPYEYYSKIAPTEMLFYEVIEKLANRYIFLKKYDVAVSLLRTIGEKTADPEQTIKLYKEILSIIPINERVTIEPNEIQYLLERVNIWLSFYKIDNQTQQSILDFIEKQLRELATTSHKLALKTNNVNMKKYYFERSQEFYKLYLGFFPNSKVKAAIALNLADVYLDNHKYLECADISIRAFNQEFGPLSPQDKKLSIKKAISVLQKQSNYSFYEQIRAKGLLIRAIKTYLAFEPTEKNNVELNFLLAKTEYDQGLYDVALNDLLGFIKKFPRSSQAQSAGYLILDYFNTREDFDGLYNWANKILEAKPYNKAFVKQVTNIRDQAKLKKAEELVKSFADYDAFEQGRGYLQLALKTTDPSIMSLALKQALAKSKKEGDFNTFFKTATVMAEQEQDKSKKLAILNSLISEKIAITEYYDAIDEINKLIQNPNILQQDKVKIYEDKINLILILKDIKLLEKELNSPYIKNISPTLKANIKEQIIDILHSPIQFSQNLIDYSLSNINNDINLLTTVYKVRSKLPSENKLQIEQHVQNFCAQLNVQALVCKWVELESLEQHKESFVQTIQKANLSADLIEQYATKNFLPIMNAYKNLQGQKDVHYNIVLSLSNYEIFSVFGSYLNNAANANPDLKDVLINKAKESYVAAKGYLSAAQKLEQKSPIITPANKYLYKYMKHSFTDLVVWPYNITLTSIHQDPKNTYINKLKKEVFSADKPSEDILLNLADTYLANKYFNHAAAVSLHGISTSKNKQAEFRSILGCATLKIGLLSEAKFHLQRANNYKNYKTTCLKQLENMMFRQ